MNKSQSNVDKTTTPDTPLEEAHHMRLLSEGGQLPRDYKFPDWAKKPWKISEETEANMDAIAEQQHSADMAASFC